MARYAYNVNTQTKLIDVHKQFRGGLKTVDSDDALGDIFLRDVNNLELSEFGFMEKRYGQYIRQTLLQGVNMTDESKVQAFFEYKRKDGNIDTIIVLDGVLYLNGLAVNFIKKQDTTLSYPALPTEWFTLQQGSEDTYDIVSGVFNTGREMEGTRIDDTLYIFTGIYPIYYIGDDNFYLLPIYEPEFLEVQEFSHNRLEDSHEGYYYKPITIGDNQITQNSDVLIENVQFQTYPRIPYNTGSGSGFRIIASYDYYESPLLANNYFNSFADVGVTQEPVTLTTNGDQRNTNLYELFARIYTRSAGGGELEWVELDASNFSKLDVRSNSITSVAPNYQRADTTKDANVFGSYSAGIISEGPIDFIAKLPLGLIDVKVEIVLRQSGYLKVLAGGTQYSAYGYDQIEDILATETLLDLFVSEEKVEDYLDYITTEEGLPSLWSCNRVINHYGKLMAYGSLEEPQRVFISHPTYKNYFPHFFTQLFTTEERDPIVKITPFSNILIVQSEDYTWGLKGTDALPDAQNPYSAFTISPIYGTIAPKSVRPVRNYLVFLSKEGIVALKSLYAVDEQYNVQPLDDNIFNIVPRDADAVAIQYDDEYWIQFPNSDNNMTLRYDVNKKAWMKDTYFNKTSSTTQSNVDFNGVFKYIRRTDYGLSYISQPLLFSGNWGIYEITFDKSLPTDLGEAYFTNFETSYLSQNYPFHLKNYKESKLEFTLLNEFNLAKEPLELSDSTVETLFHQFKAPLVKNHEYQLKYYGQNVGTTFTSLEISYDGVDFENVSFTTVTTGEDFGIDFFVPNVDSDIYYLKVTFNQDPGDIHDVVSVYDKTFDSVLSFKVWALSEQGTLNLDNLENYEEEKAEIGVNLGTQFGTWVFGESDFGTRVTAVRTVKLSGKGYNAKIYFEDFTKSKWTLESLGIVYKLKKARNS